MPLMQLDPEVNVPSIGSRPPLLRLRTQTRVTALHLLIAGAMTAAVVFVASWGPHRRPVPAANEVADPGSGTARLTRV